MTKQYLVTAEEMKYYDGYTINSLGILSQVLMERAALKVVEVISDKYLQGIDPSGEKILVVAGGGNNGGDGLAVARLLYDKGCKVDVFLLGKREHLSKETALQLNILEKYGLALESNFPEKEYDIIVDALFGIGLNREVEGLYRETIQKINSSSAKKVAVDVPSGIDTDTGNVYGAAVQADVTVTFAYAKRGLFFYPGAEYAGEVICKDIGITKLSTVGKEPEMYTLTGEVTAMLPKRRADGNKGSFGKVFLVAGSDQMAGAAVLCGKAMFRSGAGMVKICTCESNRIILQETLPEAMLLTFEDTKEQPEGLFREKFLNSLEWADCIVAGPGMGTGHVAERMLKWIIEESDLPLLLDADALNLLAQNVILHEKLLLSIEQKGRSVVLTPHAGELARLLHCSIKEIKAQPVKMARTAAAKYQAVVVSKDARTLVCGSRTAIFMNTAGNSGMATAGSGDVLSGVIGAMLATGESAQECAVLGTYLHARAGDMAAQIKGEAGVMASDIIEAVAALQKG
ncbi:MAG: NAD(P)H-hydrate dehydratase [Lachnospiraceae bacterium]|nr:NAD(P)H-hydrate dehydratase [Lachnospiraceae bacterium]